MEWLLIQIIFTIKGLTGNPDNVVLAGNRGQSHASNGNYTMFRFNRSGALTVKNITIGNYCSVDLDYPLMSELNCGKENRDNHTGTAC